MKLHLIKTNNPSKLCIHNFKLELYHKDIEPGIFYKNQLLFITDDSQIKENDLVVCLSSNNIFSEYGIVEIINNEGIKIIEPDGNWYWTNKECKKIIASNSVELTSYHLISTTDIEYIIKFYNEYKCLPDLILEITVLNTLKLNQNNEVSIQFITKEFLEWIEQKRENIDYTIEEPKIRSLVDLTIAAERECEQEFKIKNNSDETLWKKAMWKDGFKFGVTSEAAKEYWSK